jgi:SAM-dependent methyltransferase
MMAQNTKGLYKLLSPAWTYSLFQNLVGGKRVRERLVQQYVRPEPAARVLDIGCGTAQIIEFMQDVRYVGYDLSAAYIEQARARYGDRGTFCVGDVRTMQSALNGQFQIVLAMGVLHHLDDEDALNLFDTAHKVLAENGRLITIDAAFAVGQHPLARWMIRHDRGKNVRTEAEMMALATRRFPTAKAELRHNFLRIPYTHLILECPKLA